MLEKTRVMKNIVAVFRSFSLSVDIISEDNVKKAINIAVEKVHSALNAAVTEIYILSKNNNANAGHKDLPTLCRYTKGFLSDEAKKDPTKRENNPIYWNIMVEKDNEEVFENGLWTWVYRKCKPVWLNNQQEGEKGTNLADEYDKDGKKLAYSEIKRDFIPESHVKLKSYTDSTIIIPFIHKPEFDELNPHRFTNFWGLLNVELHKGDKFPEKEFDEKGQESALQYAELCKFADCVLGLMTKAAEWRLNKDHTSKAIEQLEDLDASYKLHKEPKGFFAHPIREDFTHVNQALFDIFKDEKIKIDRISETYFSKSEIARYHFIVVDMTEYDPIVMFASGVATTLKKPTLILRDSDDTKSSHPANFEIEKSEEITFIEYKRSEDGRSIYKVENGIEIPIRESRVIKKFIKDLKSLPTFRAAKRQKSG